MVERIVLALIMVAAVTSGAHAQPAPAPQAEPPPPAAIPQAEPPPPAAIPLAPPSMVAPRDPAPPAASSQWYGWQILLGDAAVFSVAGLTQNPGIAYGWVGSGAIVHFGHGNVGRGLASAALRAGLPIVGLFAGAASASGCKGDWCGLGAAVGGGLLGMASAELIDVAVLANESVPTRATVRAAQHSRGVEVSPVVRAGRSGVGLDLVGRF